MAQIPRSPLSSLVLLTVVSWLASGWIASAAVANEAPLITTPTAFEVDPGQRVFFNVTTSDPDGDRVSLEAANLPGSATFRLDGNGNGSFFWATTAADEGFYVISLIATDNGVPVLSSMADVTITVGTPNLPPVLDPVGDQEAIVGMTLVVPLSASDPEGDPLFFSTDPRLDGMLVVQGPDGTATLEYTPGPGAEGSQVLAIVVDDGTSTDEETIAIMVGEANVPPILQAIGNRQVEVGARLEIALAAKDLEGNALRFEAVGLPEGVILMDRGDGTGLIEGNPTAVGVYGVTVSVFDDGLPSEAAAESFEIDVQPTPEPEPEPEPLPEEPPFDARIIKALWDCRMGLWIAGHHVPPRATVRAYDATSDQLLGVRRANRGGFFLLRSRSADRPDGVLLSVEADGVEWMLERMEVRTLRSCKADRYDADEKDHDHNKRWKKRSRDDDEHEHGRRCRHHKKKR